MSTSTNTTTARKPSAYPKCTAIIVDYSRCTAPYNCGRTARYQYGEAWYCGHHHPEMRQQARERSSAYSRATRRGHGS